MSGLTAAFGVNKELAEVLGTSKIPAFVLLEKPGTTFGTFKSNYMCFIATGSVLDKEVLDSSARFAAAVAKNDKSSADSVTNALANMSLNDPKTPQKPATAAPAAAAAAADNNDNDDEGEEGRGSPSKANPSTLAGLKEFWREEVLTGLNEHVQFLHTKYMLIDPLSDSPIVVTGSGNFSKASVTDNDENMLVITKDLRVADIYLTEFMRLHDHWRFRSFVREKHFTKWKDRMQALDDEFSPYLAVDDSWTKPYFEVGV